MEDYIVYGLIDPLTQELRYVGKSTCGLRRPKMHFWPSNYNKRRYVYNWIKGLIHQGLKPEIIILEEHHDQSALYEAEQWNIAYWRGLGCRLTNLSDGGPGWSGPRSPETCSKISAALKGRPAPPRSPDHRRHLSESQIGKTIPEVSRRKMSLAKGGRPFQDQNGRRFESINGAGRELGIPATEICAVLKGRRRQTHGFVFAYISIDI